MSYILSLETATTNCSVSLSLNGDTLVSKEDDNEQYSHAESLHGFIEQVLREAQIEKSKLDAIAVSEGPGSYTGLRIGVSAAKGLCYALDIPLISISTLEALAQQVKSELGCIVPMLDARRMEVYSAVFDSNYNLLREVKAQILDDTSFQEELDLGPVHFIGSGVEKFKTLLTHPNAIFVENQLPSSKEMSTMAFKKFNISAFEDVAYFEPFYLKEFMIKKKV